MHTTVYFDTAQCRKVMLRAMPTDIEGPCLPNEASLMMIFWTLEIWGTRPNVHSYTYGY